MESNGKIIQEQVHPALFNTEVYLLRLVKGAPALDASNGEIRSRLLRQITNGEMKEACKQ